MKKDELCVVRLDTDDAGDINKFKELWKKLKVDVVFIPKSTKIIFKGLKGGKENEINKIWKKNRRRWI